MDFQHELYTRNPIYSYIFLPKSINYTKNSYNPIFLRPKVGWHPVLIIKLSFWKHIPINGSFKNVWHFTICILIYKKPLRVDVQFIHNFILYLVDTSDLQCSLTWKVDILIYKKKTLRVDVQFIHNFILYLVDTSDLQCSFTWKVDIS